ncbi:MAG: NADH-quinone oxidoreductase subunit L [Desulfobulbaceae bacterium]|nr:NADH-quinone oxidoreductase subunit L [Desulfobulbaceae bacterium]
MNCNILFFTILTPIVMGIVALLIPRKAKNCRECLSLLTAVAVFLAAIWIFLKGSSSLQLPLIHLGDFPLSLDLRVTPLASFIFLFASGFSVLIVLYSIPFMANAGMLKTYYAFLLFALAGSAGILFSNNLLVFLIFWEIVTASLYFLITTGGPKASYGATKTFVMVGAADACLLLGIGMIWQLTHTLSIDAVQIPVNSSFSTLAFFLMLLGALTKAGAMPLHTWIPAAGEGAPAPVMAFLPAALDKLLGIYLLVKLCTGMFILNHSLALILTIIGAITVLAAVMVAMVQHNLKKLLSYHAISQVGYMVLGIGTLNPLGIAGALFHMLNNAIYKNCLFLCSGAVEKKTGTTDLAKLGGLARAMPVTFGAFFVAALSISGIPPFNGFVSKWMIYQGALEAAGNSAQVGKILPLVILISIMFGSALTLASFIKALYSIFWGPKTELTTKVESDVPVEMKIPLVMLSLLCVGFGVFYTFPLRQFIYPAIGIAAKPMGTWNSTVAALLIVAGLVVGLIIYYIGLTLKSSRVADTYIGGEKETPMHRVRGTEFYNTIKEFPFLSGVYSNQEKGCFDPFVWFGKIGGGITWGLQQLHNGMLPRYLSYSLLGMVVLLFLCVLLG